MSPVGKAARSFKAQEHADIVAVQGDSKVLMMFDKFIRWDKHLKPKYRQAKGPKGLPGPAANNFDYAGFKTRMNLTKDAIEMMKYSTLALNRLKFLIERKKYERARKIYEHMYIKGCPLKFGGYATSTKGKFSIGEWEAFLKSKSKFIKFADKYYEFFQKTSKCLGYIDKLVKAGEVIYLLYKAGNSIERVRHAQKAKMSPKELRDEFAKSYEDMKIFVDIGGRIAKLAPIGVSDYVDMVVDVFKGAGTVIQAAGLRAESWEKELENIQKLEDKQANKYTKKYMDNVNDAAEINTELDINQKLDIIFKSKK